STQNVGRVGVDGGGNFVGVWQSFTQDGNYSGVFGQRFAIPTTLITGKQLQIKDNADPTKRKLQFSSADAGISTTTPTGIHPATDGAFLHVYTPATGDSACFTLPKNLWTAKGTGSPSFKYADKAFSAGACAKAQVKNAKALKIGCQAKTKPISYDLNE